MKQYQKLLFAGLILALFCVSVFGVKAASQKEYLKDELGVLSNSEIEELNQLLSNLSDKRGVDFVVRYLSEDAGSDYFSYVKKIAKTNIFRENAYYLVIDMSRRNMHVRSYHGVKKVFDDEDNIDLIIKKVAKGLPKGAEPDYVKAVQIFAEEMEKMHLSYFGPLPYRVWKQMKGWTMYLPAFLIAGVIFGAMASKHFGHSGTTGKDFEVEGSFRLDNRTDQFMYKTTTSRIIKESSSGGGGGGSSSGGSSSGGTRSF